MYGSETGLSIDLKEGKLKQQKCGCKGVPIYVYNKTICMALQTHTSEGSIESYKKVSRSHLKIGLSGLAKEVGDYQSTDGETLDNQEEVGGPSLRQNEQKYKRAHLEADDHNDDDDNTEYRM
jgi:hypothetical protein